MDSVARGSEIFVRLDPGEKLVESLARFAAKQAIATAAIVSGVGMLSRAELGFFDVEMDDYRRTVYEGIFDLSVILGNIVWRGGEPVPHVHAVFNDPSHATYSGHVMEATCHITMEIFLSLPPFALERVKLPDCPATRIIPKTTRPHTS